MILLVISDIYTQNDKITGETFYMFYQKILNDDTPYIAKTGKLSAFLEHRHADVEIHYILEGEANLVIDKQKYTLKSGDIAVVLPMQSHGVLQSENNKSFMAVFGVSLLKRFFTPFTKREFTSCVYSLSSSEEDRKIKEILLETSLLTQKNGEEVELLLTSNLYRICAFLLDKLCVKDQVKIEDLTQVEALDKALELVYYNYFEPITVDDGARVTGYGKSNFCKIFKKVTGYTFHDFLNRRRIEVALGLLTQSNMTVTDISMEVGFSEAKTFCRVFREIKGVTPLKYKNQEKN
jgi:AraC-like DNA-binding protein